MPAKTRAMRTQYAPRVSSSLSFELPTFTFDKESLAAGTNIPPPSRDPSPAPQKQAKKEGALNPLSSHPTTPDGSSPAGGDQAKSQENGAGPTSSATQNNQVTNQAVSPGMKRPHHVRRLLSIRSLSQTFANHGRSESAASGSDFGPVVTGRSRTPSIFGGRNSTSTWSIRPESRGGESIMGSTADGAADGGRRSLKKRMSSGFWSRRSSMAMTRLIDEKIDESPNESRKTPPPQLPEINKLEISKVKNKDGDFLNGDDMFKGIKYRPEI